MSNTDQILDSPSDKKTMEVKVWGIQYFIAISVLDILLFIVTFTNNFLKPSYTSDIRYLYYFAGAILYSGMFFSLALILKAFKESSFTYTLIYIFCVVNILQSVSYYIIGTNYYLLSYIALPSSILVLALVIMFFLVKHPFIKGHFKLLATAMIIGKVQQYLIPLYIGYNGASSNTMLLGNLLYLIVPIVILLIQLKVNKVKLQYEV
jgi:hypothetical protein